MSKKTSVGQSTLAIGAPETIKSIETNDGKIKVGAYAIRFSGPKQKDLTGEFFTAKTDLGPNKGNGVVTLFNHGLPIGDSDVMKSVSEMTFGSAETMCDEVGLFVSTTLDAANEYEKAIAELVDQGKLKWSSATANHLARKSASGEITRWHPIEFSFTPTPAEPRLPAIEPVKSIELEAELVSAVTRAFPTIKLPAGKSFSLNDLEAQVQTAATADGRFGSYPYIADLAYEGEEWFAIICTSEKCYQVGVTFGDDAGAGLSLADSMTLVRRKSEWVEASKAWAATKAAAAGRVVDNPQVEKTSIEIMNPPTDTENQKAIDQRVDARNADNAEILALGVQFKCLDKAQEFIAAKKRPNDFKGHVLETLGKAEPVKVNPNIGMSKTEQRSYSIVKAIRDFSLGKLDGLEKEAHEATAKLCKREAKGFFVPNDISSGLSLAAANDLSTEAIKALSLAVKTLNEMTFANGGALVGTDVLTSNLIEILRNRTVIAQLGARNLSGLVGNIAVPRQTGGATGYWLPESGTVTAATQTFDQLGLTPRKLMGRTGFTKELIAQTDLSVEGFVREDIMRVLAIAKDLAAIAGTGDSQPLGILNLTGRATDVTFSAAATRAKAIEFQANVATQNAFMGSLAYLTTPAVSAKWLGIAEAANYPQWLWKGNVLDGEVVGMRAVASNQVPSDKVIFGNFGDLIDANWSGIDVSVNPYTNDDAGIVTVTIMLLCDIGVRHAVSFCASTDSGAQ